MDPKCRKNSKAAEFMAMIMDVLHLAGREAFLDATPEAVCSDIGDGDI